MHHSAFRIFLWGFLSISTVTFAQQSIHRFIYFPAPIENRWRTSLGLTFMTTPKAITEEVHTRIPAGDLHFAKTRGKNITVDIHLRFQGVQNELSLGYKWLFKADEHFSFSAGNDFAGWVGWLKIEGFDTRGLGLLLYPNLSMGYKTDKDLWFSLKAELLLNIYQKIYAGDNYVEKRPEPYTGQALTFMVEQPLFKKRYVALGFRALYTNFYWQTWTLFETFDRNIFYPEIIMEFIL